VLGSIRWRGRARKAAGSRPDLDALADEFGYPAAGHRALHPGGTLIHQRSGLGSAGALARARWVGRVGIDSCSRCACH
jgi:hypothetical protein